MRYKWKTDQSSVNMKLCNRPGKGLVWRWLLKATFPPLSSWHLSKSSKENEKQRCKLHLKGKLEITKPPGHMIGERTAITGSARRVFGMLQREGALATALRKSQQSTLLKKRGTLDSQPQETGYAAGLESNQPWYEKAGLHEGWFQQQKRTVRLLDVVDLVGKHSVWGVVGWISN